MADEAVKSLGDTQAQAMMDDQKTVMHVTPKASDGSATSLPSGSAPPVYTADVATFVTLSPGIDPTGLSCGIAGIKGQAGVTNVTATFTNADGSTAVGVGVITTTIDPAELDVTSLDVTFDPPVAQ